MNRRRWLLNFDLKGSMVIRTLSGTLFLCLGQEALLGFSFGGGGRSLSKWEEGGERRQGPSPGLRGSPEHTGCLTLSVDLGLWLQ